METNPYRLVLVAMTPGAKGLRSADSAISVRLHDLERITRYMVFNVETFTAYGEGASFDNSSRTISGPAPAITGASFYRYKLGNDKGDWHVYTVDGATQAALPPVPGGLEDRAAGAGMTVHAISVRDTTLAKLVSSDGDATAHLNNLGEVIDGFSRLTCARKVIETDPDYATRCQNIDPVKNDPACNPACEVR
jgi:hypothetical protein